MRALLRDLRKLMAVACRRSRFPSTRNLVTDFVHEGRRKNLIYEVFDADITEFLAFKARYACDYSVTAFVSHIFAKTIGEQPDIQAYRGGVWGREWIVFDDVDIALIVERTIDGARVPWIHTLRSCNKMSLDACAGAIRRAKTEGIESTFNWKLARAMRHLPTFVRRLVWLIPRHSPFIMKFIAGTVAVTSVGMFGRGNLALLPATPLTLTLAIGSIETRPMLRDGELVARDCIALSICADHMIVDGAPLARFIARMKQALEAPESVLDLDRR